MSEEKAPDTPPNITIYMPSLNPRRRRNRLSLGRIMVSVVFGLALLLGFAPFGADIKDKVARQVPSLKALFSLTSKQSADPQGAKEANDDPAKALSGIASLFHKLTKQAVDAQQAKGVEDNPAEAASAIASLLHDLGEQSGEAQEAKEKPSQAASVIKQLRAQNPNWTGHRPDSHCHIKPVMTDQDYRVCNISAPAPIGSNH